MVHVSQMPALWSDSVFKVIYSDLDEMGNRLAMLLQAESSKDFKLRREISELSDIDVATIMYILQFVSKRSSYFETRCTNLQRSL